MLFDSIHRVTGSQSRLPGLPAGARAAQLVDSNVDLPGGFLELFGKPVRESACECERSNTMMLGPVLAMVNGPIVADAIKDPNGSLAKFTAATKDDAKVVEEVYLAVLNRRPTAAELKAGVAAVGAAGGDFDRLTADHKRKLKSLTDYEATLPAKQAAWEAGLIAQKPTAWTVVEPKSLKAASGATFTKQPDGSYLVGGKNTGQELYTLAVETKLANVTAVRLEALADPSLPAKGPGRAENGNLVLHEFKATTKPLSKKDEKPKAVAFKNAQATFSQDGFPVGNAVDNNPGTGWALSGKLGQDNAALFAVSAKVADPDGVEWVFTLDQRYGSNHTLGRFRLSFTTDPQPKLGATVSKELMAMLETPAKDRAKDVQDKLRGLYTAQDREYQRLRAEASAAPPSDARVLGAQDLVWALINSPAFLFNR